MTYNVFFIDESDSSRFNGIGTFLKNLIPELATNDSVNTNLVSLNSPVNNLEIKNQAFGKEFRVPYVAGGNWRENGSSIWPLLSMYIPDSASNAFFFNHSPCSEFISVFKRIFQKSKCSFIIHDQGWCGPLFGDSKILKSVLSGKESSAFSKNTVEYVRNYCKWEQDIYDLADSVVCLSDSTEKILKSIYRIDPAKLFKIYNGFSSENLRIMSKKRARKKLGIPLDCHLLIFVARAVPHKGVIPLLKAIRQLRNRYTDIRCALAGQMKGFLSYQDIEKPIASNLIYTGHLDKNELSTWYDAADVGVISSYTEQCSYAGLEMMRHRLAIVASDGNNVADMFRNNINAFSAHIGDVTNSDAYSRRLAKSIDKALNCSSEDLDRFHNENLRLMNSKYSCKYMANNYIEMISRII